MSDRKPEWMVGDIVNDNQRGCGIVTATPSENHPTTCRVSVIGDENLWDLPVRHLTFVHRPSGPTVEQELRIDQLRSLLQRCTEFVWDGVPRPVPLVHLMGGEPAALRRSADILEKEFALGRELRELLK